MKIMIKRMLLLFLCQVGFVITAPVKIKLDEREMRLAMIDGMRHISEINLLRTYSNGKICKRVGGFHHFYDDKDDNVVKEAYPDVWVVRCCSSPTTEFHGAYVFYRNCDPVYKNFFPTGWSKDRLESFLKDQFASNSFKNINIVASEHCEHIDFEIDSSCYIPTLKVFIDYYPKHKRASLRTAYPILGYPNISEREATEMVSRAKELKKQKDNMLTDADRLTDKGKRPEIDYDEGNRAQLVVSDDVYPANDESGGESCSSVEDFFALIDKRDFSKLMEKEELFNSLEYRSYTPLMHAVANNDIETALFFLESGVDPNQANSYGYTPLMIAVDLNDSRNSDYHALINWLLAYGASPDAVTSAGQSALDIAMRKKDLKVAALLVTKNNSSAALFSALKNSMGTQWIDLFLGYEPNPNYAEIDGVTSLMLAAQKGDHRLVRQLLFFRDRIDMRDNLGKSIFDYAMNSKEVMEVLMRNRLIREVYDSIYKRLSVQNDECGHAHEIEDQVKHRQELNRQLELEDQRRKILRDQGNTDLMIEMKLGNYVSSDLIMKMKSSEAAEYVAQAGLLGEFSSVRFLIDRKNDAGETALSIAFQNMDYNLVFRLIKCGGASLPLDVFMTLFGTRRGRDLLKKIPAQQMMKIINQRDKNDIPLLVMAVRDRNRELIKFLDDNKDLLIVNHYDFDQLSAAEKIFLLDSCSTELLKLVGLVKS